MCARRRPRPWAPLAGRWLVEALVLALTDEERAVRHAAEMALGLIDPGSGVFGSGATRGPAVEAALNDQRGWVRSAASQVLRHPTPRALALAHSGYSRVHPDTAAIVKGRARCPSAPRAAENVRSPRFGNLLRRAGTARPTLRGWRQ